MDASCASELSTAFLKSHMRGQHITRRANTRERYNVEDSFLYGIRVNLVHTVHTLS